MNLKQYIQSRASNPHPNQKRQTYSIALATATALQDLHSKNILHRDIKPENFELPANFMKENGEAAKVSLKTDPKIALQLAPNQSGEAGLGVVGGTLGYIAPEIAIEGKTSRNPMVKEKDKVIFKNIGGKYSRASDIYALGVMFKKDLKLAEEGSPLKPLIDRMLKEDPSARPTMAEIVTVMKNPENYQAFEKTYSQLWQYRHKANTGGQLKMVADIEKILNDYRANKNEQNVVGTAVEILKVLKENQARHDKSFFSSIVRTTSSFNLETVQHLPIELKQEVMKQLNIQKDDPSLKDKDKLAQKISAYQPGPMAKIPKDETKPQSPVSSPKKH